MANLSFISLQPVECNEKNIFTNRKPVPLYVRNKLHENTALVADNVLFLSSYPVVEQNKLVSFE